MDAVLASLAREYPEGALWLSRWGKRVSAPDLVPWRRGYKVNIAGVVHHYDAEGRFVSIGDPRLKIDPERF